MQQVIAKFLIDAQFDLDTQFDLFDVLGGNSQIRYAWCKPRKY
jgi:hypothetical protein